MFLFFERQILTINEKRKTIMFERATSALPHPGHAQPHLATPQLGPASRPMAVPAAPWPRHLQSSCTLAVTPAPWSRLTTPMLPLAAASHTLVVVGHAHAAPIRGTSTLAPAGI
jgi:hypothetical protein